MEKQHEGLGAEKEQLLAAIDKSVERWTWDRYRRIEQKLLPQIEGMVAKELERQKFLEVCRYLQEGDNFKRVYEELSKEQNATWKYWYRSGRSEQSYLGIKLPSGPQGEDTSPIRDVYYRDLLMMNKQSLAFYSEVIPYFYECCQQFGLPEGNSFTLLDVGTRTGAGANLLGETFADPYWGYRYKFVVDTIDIDKDWNDYVKLHPFIRNSSNRNLFSLGEHEYDVCFCSHTIEHLDEPAAFVRQAQKVARKFVFFTCPFEEENPIPEHRTVTRALVESLEPKYFKTYKSVNRWKPELECVIFAL